MTELILSAFSDESGEATLAGQIAACKANAITHMELRGFGKAPNVNNITPDQAKAMRKELDEAGMRISAVGSAYGKIHIKEPFAPHFKAFQNTVEVAKILGAPNIRIFSFYFHEGDSHAQYRDEVISRVKTMADYAASQGVLACHENEKGIYGDTAERCLDLLQNCGGHLRGVFDPANFVQCGVQTLPAFRLLWPYTQYLHIKDALYETGGVVPAGAGDGHLREILCEALRREGKLILTLEPHLQVFEGLQNLEEGAETKRAMPTHAYPSHAASFKAAADALHALIQSCRAEVANQ